MRKIIVVILAVILLVACDGPEDGQQVDTSIEVELNAWIGEGDIPVHIQYTDSLIIHFNIPMDSSSVDRPFRLTPGIAGDFSWENENTTVIFTPINGFPIKGGEYRIIFADTLVSESGLVFPKGNELEVYVDPALSPFVANQSSFKIITSTDPTVIIKFRDLMDTDSVEDHLVIEPEVEYSLDWQYSNLQITLLDGIEPNAEYTIRLTAGARQASGYICLEDEISIRFDDLQANISRKDPQNRLSPFEIQFNYPVKPEQVEELISIDSNRQFQLEWQGDQRLFLYPVTPMGFGESIEIKIPTDPITLSGHGLEKEKTLSYISPSVVAGVDASNSTAGKVWFKVRFMIEPDLDSVLDSIDFEPVFEYISTWDPDKMSLTLESSGSLPSSTEVKFSLIGTIRDVNQDPVNVSLVKNFTTTPLVSFEKDWNQETSPWSFSGVDPYDAIRVQFNRDMNRESVEEAITIFPTTDVIYTWDSDHVLQIEPVTFFTEGVKYKFSINESILDLSGNSATSNEISWFINMGPMKDSVIFGVYGTSIEVVDMDGNRIVDVGTPYSSYRQEFESIRIEMVRLTETQFVDFLEFSDSSSYYLGRGAIYDTSSIAVQATWKLTKDELNLPYEGNDSWGIVIPEYVPEGLYIMNIVTDHINDQLAVVASTGSVVAKLGESQSGAGQITVWVNNINSYMVQDAEVSLYDLDGNILASGTTDDIGFFQSTYNTANVPYLVVAKRGSMYAVTGLDSEWEQKRWYDDYVEFWLGPPVPEEYFVYTYTDRPIYKPGQTINYKSIVRYDWDVEFHMPDAGEMVEIRLRDARGNLLQSQQVILNRYGSVNGSFDLPEGTMLGDYSIEVDYHGEVHKQRVKVQEYRKPDYSVSVTTNEEVYIVGDEVTVTIDAQYLFGEPVADAEVRINLYELAETKNLFWYLFDDEGSNGDNIDVDGLTWFETAFITQTATTDQFGKASFTIKLPNGNYFNAKIPVDWYYDPVGLYFYSIFGIEVTLEDESSQPVSGFTRIKAYSTAAKLDLETDWLADAGNPTSVNVVLSSNHGMEISEQEIQLKVSKWGSYWSYNEIAAYDLITDTKGRTNLTLELEEGYYKLEAVGKDDRGSTISNYQYLYVYDKNTGIWSQYDNDLSLDSNKTSYNPGEIAEIMVVSSYGGEGLLTIERGGVLDYMAVRIEPPFSILKVPIHSDYAPNVFITLQLWQPTDPELDNDFRWHPTIPDSRLYSAKIEINVEDFTHELSIEINSDKDSYSPGETANFYITVTNYKGEPVDAELSVALVDEAIFLLSEDLNLPIHDAFFIARDHEVESFNSMMPRRWIFDPGGRGGGGPGGNTPGEGVNPRSDFPDTLIWIPRIVVDKDGKARVTVTMPDSLTTWRFTTKAVTQETEIGENSLSVITQKPVVVRPLLPQALREGDKFQLSSLVHNYSDESLTFEVSLVASQLEILSDLTQSIEVASGDSQMVSWQAAVQTAGDVLVEIYAESEKYSDAVALPITVNSKNYLLTETNSGNFETRLSTVITIPQDYLPGSTVTLEIDRTISNALLNGVEYLTGFPYGCVEQIMSRALPNAVVARAFTLLGQEDRIGAAELENKISKSIQRLYAMQHDDGGWGWWYDDSSTGYQTSWVLYGLGITAQNGYQIDPQVIESAVNYLEENLADMDAFTQAYALYAMSIVDHSDLEAALALTEKFTELDLFSQSALILTLWQLEETEIAHQLLDLVLMDIESQPNGYVYFSGLKYDGHYAQKTMSSEVRSNALLLKAILTIDPEHWSVDGMVSWLMSKRGRYGWGSTNETAFTMLALTDYFKYEQTSGQDYILNGNIGEFRIDQLSIPTGQPSVVVTIPYEYLSPGENSVEVITNASGKLYYSLISETVTDKSPETSGAAKIERSYLDPTTNSVLTEIKEGDLVLVQLEILITKTGYYLLIEDQLPGGFSALNEGLAITSHEDYLSEYPVETEYRWKTLNYNNKEIYPDKVVFFATEWKPGTHTIRYFARAMVSGTFTVLPAEISAMYDNTFFGFSGLDILEITQ